MAEFVYTYDIATPVGTQAPSVLDDRIVEAKAATQERLNVEHVFELTGTEVSDAATGQHRFVEFYAPITKPTNAANKGWLYTKDVGGVVELHWLDESGNEVQLTTGGILNSANLSGDQTVAGEKTFSSAANFSDAIVSTLETGTAPLTVASTTKVTNLNADKVDGYDAAAYSGGESHTCIGGLIIKTGHAYSTVDTAQLFTFGSAFPNGCIAVVTNPTTAGFSKSLAVSSRSKTGFYIDRDDDISGTHGFYWIATGY